MCVCVYGEGGGNENRKNPKSKQTKKQTNYSVEQ